MQSFSSKIWTRVTVSISYDDNDYTTGASCCTFILPFIVTDIALRENKITKVLTFKTTRVGVLCFPLCGWWQLAMNNKAVTVAYATKSPPRLNADHQSKRAPSAWLFDQWEEEYSYFVLEW